MYDLQMNTSRELKKNGHLIRPVNTVLSAILIGLCFRPRFQPGDKLQRTVKITHRFLNVHSSSLLIWVMSFHNLPCLSKAMTGITSVSTFIIG
jgi:hypothetical protein